MGPRAGQKVFSLQTVPAREEGLRKGVAQYAEFSLHAGLSVEADQRQKLDAGRDARGRATQEQLPSGSPAT
jgi:hypothetical protein